MSAAPRAKYCSRACRNKFLATAPTKELPCAACGKMMTRMGHQQAGAFMVCSIECRSVMRMTPATKATKATKNQGLKRWMLIRGMLTKCERCGYREVPEILQPHHRDRDAQNNDMKNIETLCPNCHAVEHLAERKRGWRHKSTHRVNRKPR